MVCVVIVSGGEAKSCAYGISVSNRAGEVVRIVVYARDLAITSESASRFAYGWVSIAVSFNF